MSGNRIVRRSSLFAGLAVVVALFAGTATLVLAQEGQSASQTLPIRHASGVQLTEQQVRGAGVFFQRCSLCHLAKSGEGGSKYCCVRSLGPDLSGRFNNLTPDQENAFKDIILSGGPTYMPSWKYALSPEEIDDIIAYLKTLS
jgi:mono/diheme cytochrome c family protein